MAATDNLSRIAFTPAELTSLDGAITTIVNLFISKGAEVLPPDDRRDFGKVAMKRIGFVKMVYDDVKRNPTLLSPRVPMADWDIDIAAEIALSPRLSQVENLFNLLYSSTILATFDMYTAANSCYRYVRLLAQEGDPVAATFYDKWKAQYDRSSGDETPPRP